MADLSSRVDALEAENAALKEKVEALSARIESLEKGGGAKPTHKKRPSAAGAAKVRPATAGAKVSARPATAKSGGAKKKKATGPSKDLQDRLNKSVSVDFGDVPADRKGNYHIGKTKVFFVLPEEYAGAEAKSPAPGAELQLSLARGFNGKGCRGNLHYGKGGGIIYCIAGTGVVMSPDGKQTFFTGHNEDILSLAVHPTEPIVATGQLDPKGPGTPYICIWKESGELIKKITYHARGVVCLAFSPDGTYLASVGNDDNHELALWDWQSKGKEPLLVQNSSKDTVHDISFAPAEEKQAKGSYTLVAVGAKMLKVFSIDGLHKKEKKERTAKARAPSTFAKTNIVQKGFFGVHYGAEGEWYVGCASGHVYKMKGGDYVKNAVASKKKGANALCSMNDGNFAVGTGDANIVIFDSSFKQVRTLDLGEGAGSTRSIAYRDGKFLVGTNKNQLYQVEEESGAATLLIDGHSEETWGVAHSPTEPLLATVAEDKTLKFWETGSNSLTSVASIKMTDKARSVVFSPDGKTVAVGQWNGTVSIVDVASKEVTSKNKIADETVDALAFSQDGALLAAGSWDQMVYLIDPSSGKATAKMKGHTSSVLHIQFSDDNKFIMTSSRDYESLFWSVESKSRVEKVQDVMDVKFSNWTNFLGWPVQGIWEGASDGTDVNSVASSPDGKLLAVGDDFGMVRLYSFPSLQEDAPRKEFKGHSSHVTCVRWNQDGSKLFSAGGHDCGVFEWSKA